MPTYLKQLVYLFKVSLWGLRLRLRLVLRLGLVLVLVLGLGLGLVLGLGLGLGLGLVFALRFLLDTCVVASGLAALWSL